MRKHFIPVLCAGVALIFASGSALAGGDAKKGEKFYKKRCKLCHTTKGNKHKNGPSLAGIFGKNAASTDFDKYLGLKNKKDIVWDEANLDAYLANPEKFVGEKSMVLKVKKESERADVIEYLKTLK